MRKYIFILLFILALGAMTLAFPQKKEPSQGKSSIILGGTAFDVIVADTEALREQGLSGRLSLGDRQAMFFVFDTPALYGFWMKDMRFAIDIVWLDEEGRVVSFEKKVSPDTYPKVFQPAALSKYVIELTAGTVDSLGIKIGDAVGNTSFFRHGISRP